MMKRFRPSIWLTFIMVFWSLSMICQGFVKNYSGLMATRVFLGIFEGGLFPGVNFYIASWYCRHGKRFSQKSLVQILQSLILLLLFKITEGKNWIYLLTCFYRMWFSNGAVLLCGYTCWGFWRYSCSRNCRDGRCRRQISMGLDFHPRRFAIDPSFIYCLLGHQWLSRHVSWSFLPNILPSNLLI